MNDINEDEIPLTDALDTAILMHRDAHFGGIFGLMIEYYVRGGKGVQPDFDLERIQQLADIEAQTKENLAGVLLSGTDAEKVASAREAYKALRDLYKDNKPFSKHPRLIADLVLSEEEDPEKEIEAIVKEKGTIVKALIDLIQSEDFHDPLFPGYGQAPALAIRCLGLIGDKRAVITLFEALDSGDFFEEEVALDALHGLGDPAQQFLLKVLHAKPLTGDNEKAALALIKFRKQPEVLRACMDMLKDPHVRKSPLLATYLVLNFEGATDTDIQQEFLHLRDDLETPAMLRKEMQAIEKTFYP